MHSNEEEDFCEISQKCCRHFHGQNKQRKRLTHRTQPELNEKASEIRPHCFGDCCLIITRIR
ncbi:AAEL005608-PA [Aedes aegypti]|uniref:AAEL005608-PA n=1 Tax=Aedes aegypti TaxID=7159 RepID=Q179H6_AEDAE|nr:AAEL005608-PA [Aedes aegypti]